MPRGETQTSASVWLANDGRERVTVRKNSLVAAGSGTGKELKATVVALTPGDPVGPESVREVSLNINPRQMDSDGYIGADYVRLTNGDDKLTIPVEGDVRSGPFLAILALAGGLTLGLIALGVKGRGGQQADALNKIQLLSWRIKSLSAPDHDYMALQLKGAHDELDYGSVAEANKMLDSIPKGIEMLGLVEELEKEIAGKHGSKYDTAADTIKDIRAKVRAGKYPDAWQEASGLYASLRDERDAEVASGAPTEEAVAAAQHAWVIREQLRDTVFVTRRRRGTLTMATGRLRGWLTGQTHHLAPAAWKWARLVVRVGTVILLLYVGFNTLYLKDPTFGNDGLVDYLALVAWGLGTDIASRLATAATGAAATAATA